MLLLYKERVDVGPVTWTRPLQELVAQMDPNSPEYFSGRPSFGPRVDLAAGLVLLYNTAAVWHLQPLTTE